MVPACITSSVGVLHRTSAQDGGRAEVSNDVTHDSMVCRTMSHGGAISSPRRLSGTGSVVVDGGIRLWPVRKNRPGLRCRHMG